MPTNPIDLEKQNAFAYEILSFMRKTPEPFAVFVMGGKLILVGVESADYAFVSRKISGDLIGVYTRASSVTDVLADIFTINAECGK